MMQDDYQLAHSERNLAKGSLTGICVQLWHIARKKGPTVEMFEAVEDARVTLETLLQNWERYYPRPVKGEENSAISHPRG